MHWNSFCLFATMCFTSRLTEYDIGDGSCTFFQSEDVNKKSLVINTTKMNAEGTNPNDCLKLGPFNTILFQAPEDSSSLEEVIIVSEVIEYDHLIVLNQAKPMNFCPNGGSGKMRAVSLIVHKNSNLLGWGWPKCIKYRYIRIDNCQFSRGPSRKFDDLILSEHLLTLTLVNNKNLDPWTGFRYYLAPNLRELTINDFKLRSLSKQLPESSFPKLKRLNLRNNQIETLEESFFDNMPLLEEIVLERNQLKTFFHQFKSAPKNLFLDENPLVEDPKTCQFLKSTPFVHYADTRRLCGRDEL